MNRFKYTTKDLINFLKINGIKKNSNIFIHSSWQQFYNYKGSVNELLKALIEEFGVKGTIAMPSYFPYRIGINKEIIGKILTDKNIIFDIKKTPTMAGIIPEEFRKLKNVFRSVDRHSVCAYGVNADYLVNEHKNSLTHWDKFSPYFKLSKINATVITLGVGSKFVGTIMHCADSILRNKLKYFNQFFTKKTIHRFRLENNTLFEKTVLVHDDNFYYKFNYNNHSNLIYKFYDKKFFKRRFFSNLAINFYDANYFINKTIELAKKGIVFYTYPIFKK